MLWEHEPQASVSTAFWSSPKLSLTSICITRQKHGVHIFYFFQKTPRREKGKQLVNFDYQKVNSLCSRHRYVCSACQLCASARASFFKITAEIHARSLANFYCQYTDRHMNLKFMRRVSESLYFDNVMTKFMINNRTDA